jgi:hypothetical protein
MLRHAARSPKKASLSLKPLERVDEESNAVLSQLCQSQQAATFTVLLTAMVSGTAFRL